MSNSNDLDSAFFQTSDEAEEDIRLSQSASNQHLFIRMAWFLRRKLQIFYSDNFDDTREDLPLDESKTQPDFERNRKLIKFYRLPNIFRKTPVPDACPMLNFVLNIINTISSLDYMIMLILTVYFQKMYDKWHPQVRPSANRTELCAPRGDIYEPDTQLGNKLRQMRKYLIMMGAPVIDSGQLLVFGLMVVIITTIMMYLGALLGKNRKFYLNSLSFYLNPVEERKRIKVRLMKIADNLYRDEKPTSRTFESPWDSIGIKYKTTLECSQQNQSQLELANISGYPIENLNTQPCYCIEDNNEFARSNFTRNIISENLVQFVRPSNLSHRFHLVMSRRHLQTVTIYGFLMIGMILVVVYVTLSGELYSRTRNRLEQFKCEALLQDGTLIKDVFDFGNSHLDEYDKNVYISYMNNTDRSVLGIYWVESKRILTYGFLKTAFEVTVTCLIICAWLFDYIWSFLQGCIFSLEWVRQIQEQMDLCINSITNLQRNEHQLHNQSNNNNNNNIDLQSLETVKRRERDKRTAERALTVTYLNFELFRREYPEFRSVTNFINFNWIPIVLLNSAAAYLIVSTFKRDVGFIYAINYSCIFGFNLYVSFCVTLLRQIQKLYRSITMILVRSSLSSLNHSEIINLWRRQVMSESEVIDSYSLQLSGCNFSLSTLIAIDSYIIALWMTLFRLLTQ